MLSRIFSIGGLFIATFLFMESTSYAQPKKKEQKNDVEEMSFEDDKLLTSNLSPDQAKITARSGPIRTILARPRITFVPQLLQSIENI